MVVIESFASDRTAAARNPVDIDSVELRNAFKGYRIVRFEDVVAKPDWGDKDSRLVRLVAEKRLD